MEPKFQTSFIPKKPIVTGQNTGVSMVHETNIFSIVATILFIVTLLSAGGLFAYKSVLTKQITVADDAILQAQSDLQTDTIKELVDANSRIMASKNILDKHVVVSKILALLNQLTVKRMRYSSLSYENKNNLPTVAMEAEVQTYNALAEQQVIFSENEFVKSPQFSDFNLSDNGNVLVNFVATIDPMLISYKKAVEALPATQ
jgi:hypothetical protein